jgi:ethanolamine phosphate transferase 2 subunit G
MLTHSRTTEPKGLQAVTFVLGLASLRIIRGWNQTGQKLAGGPDLVKAILQPNPLLLWMLVSLTYLQLHRALVRGFDGLSAILNVTATTALMLAAFSFKLAFTNEDSPELVRDFGSALLDVTQGATLVARARAVFVGLGIASMLVLGFTLGRAQLSKKASRMSCSQLVLHVLFLLTSRLVATETIRDLYCLLALTQSRATNIPLFLFFNALNWVIETQSMPLTELSTMMVLLQFASFFAMGGTNAISSVDLSSAYNGISGFNVGLVGVLTFVGNFAAPIYWTFAANLHLLRRRREGERDVFTRHVALLTLFTAANVLAVMLACTALRTHLFIWTVFSPKYLYCIVWALGMHLVVNILIGGLLFSVGVMSEGVHVKAR